MSRLACMCHDPEKVLGPDQHFADCPQFPDSRDAHIIGTALTKFAEQVGVSPKTLAKMANAIFNRQIELVDNRADDKDEPPYETTEGGAMVRDRRSSSRATGKEST